MRRFLLPAVVLAVVIAASIQAGRANDAAEPDERADTTEAALTTPIFNARRAPEWLRQPTTDDLLDDAVSAALTGVPDDAPVCLAVRRGGVAITETNATTPLIPGDLQRLSTLMAFDTVSTNGFTTEIVRNAADPVEEGVLQGDLYLIGGADPVLSTPGFAGRLEGGVASTSLLDLAADAVEALGDEGITEVAGAIVGVDLKYADSPQSNDPGDGSIWSSADVASNAVGVVDGLIVDNGLTGFDPESLDPSARVRATDPASHAAGQLEVMLELAGVPVGGFTAGAAPETTVRETLASIESPPLAAIGRRALADATTAEMLYSELGFRSGAASDLLPLNGFFQVSTALQTSGLVAEDQVGNFGALDGSGLSLANRGSCGIAADILALENTLPVDALTGFVDADAAPCVPSGIESLDVIASARPEVTAAAGRVTASNGDMISFAVIVNWTPDAETGALLERTVCDDVVPALLDAIADHPGGPDLDEITPLPVGDGS
ncbi:MAG: D-alanyl-D-alanine carboxypeptidase [Actinomycetota bacterium]